MKREKRPGTPFHGISSGTAIRVYRICVCACEPIPFFPPAESALPGEKDIASPADEAKAFSLSRSHHALLFHR